ncbi:hypothetical protein [Caulobacter soli]|uniref:hypothetical protein n=1 Tax=Caulobacter soli TaxID=2708539 RepID=UPI0013EDE275|nr:hypothetical protein [Caulobacter soli]
MAYVGYDSRLHPPSRAARPARSKLAWGRLAAVAASLLAWVGIIATVRAIF